MKHWLLIISCFIVFISTITAQQLIFKTYTVEDGLVANPVRRIFQDSRGFIWVATWEGLSKYDGHKFTNYTTANGLSHNMVNDMFESADGKLYVAENNGTIDILQNNAIIKKAAFKHVVINQFYSRKNNSIIAATDTGGLQEIKNGMLVKPPNQVSGSSYNDVTELNDSLLLGGAEGFLNILNRKFETVSVIKLPKGLLIFKIFKDSKNKIWIGTNNGLKLLSPPIKNNKNLHFTLLPSPFNIPVLKDYNINDILEEPDGNFWIATSHGLVKIHPDSSWQVFLETDGLPSANISCIYQDKENNIWIGSVLGIAKLVTRNSIRIYTVNKGLTSNNENYLLLIKPGLFMVGSETGTHLYNTTTGLFSAVNSQHNINYNGLVKNSHPTLLFRGDNRFGKFDSIKSYINEHMLPTVFNAEVYCSVIDANGIIFSGTQKGLFINSANKSYYDNKLPYRITDLLIDKKSNLWVSTWDNGLYRINYTIVKNIINLSVKDYSYLLPDKNSRCMFEDRKGNIWIGTRYDGIVQLHNTSENQYTVKHLDIKQGLMSNWTRAIAEGDDNCIWVGSDLGLDKLIPADTSYRIFNFSYINNYFARINAISPEINHSLWLTTNRGFTNILDGETEKTLAAPVYITSVGLGDSTFNYSSHQLNTKVKLKYNQNQAKFEFSAPTFINEKQILYSYRLLGSADTIWSTPVNLHTVSYASLQPGTYQFEVRTKGWNREWGTSANFAFSIRPPWWQTWWFYSLIGMLILLFFYSLYIYRIRQILKLQKVRNRIATDLHDDIGSTLTNINMLAEISRKNLEKPYEAEKFLQRITEEVTTSSQALNDIIWSVNSRNDSMAEIFLRMRRYAAELFDNSNAVCHLAMDESIAGKKLNMEQRRDVYLIYKECMNNILKHAAATNIWIDIQWQSGKLYMKIKDDGKGFNLSGATDRNGLRNIRFRTDKWKGSTSVTTTPGSGCLIEIIIPLEE